MKNIQNKDTRYFIEIDLTNMKILKCSFEQKDNLDKGRQHDPAVHRLFITEGQYAKLVNRCSSEFDAIIKT